jgi:hypothetical protein
MTPRNRGRKGCIHKNRDRKGCMPLGTEVMHAPRNRGRRRCRALGTEVERDVCP